MRTWPPAAKRASELIGTNANSAMPGRSLARPSMFISGAVAMGQKQQVRSIVRAVVERMEARCLMSVSADEIVFGPARNERSDFGSTSYHGGDRRQMGADAYGKTLYVRLGDDGFDIKGQWFDRTGVSLTGGEVTLARREGTSTL